MSEVIHHVDGNPSNNSPENLASVEAEEGVMKIWKWHKQQAAVALKQSKEAKEALLPISPLPLDPTYIPIYTFGSAEPKGYVLADGGWVEASEVTIQYTASFEKMAKQMEKAVWQFQKAAIGGLSPSTYHPTIMALSRLVPALSDTSTPCPATQNEFPCGYPRSPIASVIMHLNDSHHWTREGIADWLDSLEDVDLTVKPQPKAEELRNAIASAGTSEEIVPHAFATGWAFQPINVNDYIPSSWPVGGEGFLKAALGGD